MITLYDYLSSGNGYKVRLLLSHLGLAYRRVELDIDANETHTPEFLAVNPNGKIPAVVLDDGRALFESGAILNYFAAGTPYLPDESFARAHVLQWMFFEQYSHEPAIAVSRYILQHTADDSPRRAELPGLQVKGAHVLGVMERHLSARDFFAGGYSIAYIALFGYTHVADEGGFDLSGYPAITAWLDRVRAQPGHIPITQG